MQNYRFYYSYAKALSVTVYTCLPLKSTEQQLHAEFIIVIRTFGARLQKALTGMWITEAKDFLQLCNCTTSIKSDKYWFCTGSAGPLFCVDYWIILMRCSLYNLAILHTRICTLEYVVLNVTVISYVYMDTFCFHPNEFILIVKSERSVYMNAK